jgi:hypothetical protein
MEVQKDFKELLELLNRHEAKYVIVGAYALAFYGHPRYTGDLDILIAPEIDNANKIINAIKEFGLALKNLKAEDFLISERVIQLGISPLRIDILTSLTGLSWKQIFSNKMQGEYAGVPVYFIGKEELKINKKALGRHKDLADLESIKEN